MQKCNVVRLTRFAHPVTLFAQWAFSLHLNKSGFFSFPPLNPLGLYKNKMRTSQGRFSSVISEISGITQGIV